MAQLDVLVSIGTAVIGLGLLAAAGVSYVLFVRQRRLAAALAMAGGGVVTGALFGNGLPVLAGGALGGVAGVAIATAHSRGGTVAVGLGTGFAVAPLVVVFVESPAALGTALGAGAVLGVLLVGLGWRFPRGMILPGLSASIGSLLVLLAGAGPASVQSVQNGVLIASTPYQQAGAVNYLLGPIFFGLLGGMMQPLLVEFTDGVPPVLPAKVRGALGATDAGQGVPPAVKPPCPECGTIRDPGHGVCPHCETITDTNYALPDDAVALDVPCPQCGERPIEELGRAYRVRGMLLLYSIRTDRIVGCHRCVRRRMWGATARTLLTGWWSISSLLLNPIIIVRNLLRGLYNAGPNRDLLGVLDDAGVEYEFLSDPAEFDAPSHGEKTLVVAALAQVGAAVMLADGRPSRAQATELRDALLAVTDEHSPAAVEDLIETAAADRPDPASVAESLAGLLTPEGHAVAVELAARVASADGAPGDDEAAAVAAVAEALNVSGADATTVDTSATPA